MRLIILGATWAISMLVCGAVAWNWVLREIPDSVIEETRERFIEIAGGENTIYHLRRYGPGLGRIPRSNPDIMTSMCVYNTLNGPVEFGGDVWKEYWSISLYQANGDNFYVINDEDVDTTSFRALIDHRQGSDMSAILAPEPQGILIVRRFVPSELHADAARANQDTTFCRPMR